MMFCSLFETIGKKLFVVVFKQRANSHYTKNQMGGAELPTCLSFNEGDFLVQETYGFVPSEGISNYVKCILLKDTSATTKTRTLLIRARVQCS